SSDLSDTVFARSPLGSQPAATDTIFPPLAIGKFVGMVFVWNTFQLSPFGSTAYSTSSFFSAAYFAIFASGSLNTYRLMSPWPLYASSSFWKYASSLSQPEQPQV